MARADPSTVEVDDVDRQIVVMPHPDPEMWRQVLKHRAALADLIRAAWTTFSPVEA